MGILFIFITALALVVNICPAFAAKGGEKGASDKAYEHTSDSAKFKRVNNWFTCEKGKPDGNGDIKENKKAGKKKGKREGR